jgi:hypothetical protein
MVGFCVRGNELWDCIKCGKFLGLPEELVASQEGLCSVALDLL